MLNELYKNSSDRNGAVTSERFSKSVQSHYLPPARLRCLVEFADVPFQNIIVHLDLFALEFQCLNSSLVHSIISTLR